MFYSVTLIFLSLKFVFTNVQSLFSRCNKILFNKLDYTLNSSSFSF